MTIHIGTCFRFYMQILYMVKLLTIDFILECIWKKNNKAFAYRVPIGDYNYLQCSAYQARLVAKVVTEHLIMSTG